MRPYLALFTMFIRESFSKSGAIFGILFVHTFHVMALFGIYSVAFHARGGSLSGMDIISTLWSIRVYFIVLSLGVRLMAKEMAKEIRFGSVETKLNKPFNYLFAAWATQLGKGTPHIVASSIFNISLLLLIVGFPHISFSIFWIVGVLALLFGGIALGLLFYGIIGLCAVWLEDVDPLYWVMDKGVMLLGGAYIPVALFPSGVRAVGEHTPFGAIMFAAQIFNPNFSARWSGLFLTQVVWICVFAVAAVFVYRGAMKHISVNGG